MHEHLKLSKLYIYDPAQSRNETEIFVGSLPEAENTKLIIIIDFPRGRQNMSYLTDLVIKECVNTFNQTDESNPEIILEHILAALNILLPDISPKKSREWLDSLNLIVAISDKGQVHFSHLGDISVWLLNNNRLSLLNQPNKDFKPIKLFSEITSGLLNPEDVFLLTTNALTDYISEVKLKSILRQMLPAEAVENIEDLLTEVPHFVSFASVIIKFSKAERSTAKLRQTLSIAGETSANEGYGERPARPINIRTGEKMQPINRRLERRGKSWRFNSGLIKRIVAFVLINGWHYFLLLAQIAKKSFRGLISGFKFITKSSYRQNSEQLAWQNIEQNLENSWLLIRRQTRWNKIILAATTIILLALFNLIIFQGQSSQVHQGITSFNETMITLGQMQTEVDSAQMYNDNVKAENILLVMQSQLQELLPQNDDQKTQIQTLNEKISRQLNEARRINVIATPLLLHDLVGLNQNVLSLGLIKDQIYALTADGLYQQKDTAEKIATFTSSATSQLLINRDRVTIFILSGNELKRLDKQSVVPVSIRLNDQMKSADRALIYSDNLYFLDKQSGIIFKHLNVDAGNNFGTGTVWLNEPALVQTVQDFAIDGNIYLLDNAGEIIKLFKGQRVPFTYQKPRPAFGAGSSIFTTRDSQYLYILDPANQRIAIITKDGQIKDQYTSPIFTQLKSMVIDQEEKTIYILNDQQVYILAIKNY